MTNNANDHVPMGTGFESAAIYWRDGNAIWVTDAFHLSQHDRRFREDLQLAWDSGIRELRYPLLWHRIQPAAGQYDWSWTDEVMTHIHEMGFEVLADPFHFCCPPWIEDGFCNPEAPRYYLDYLTECAQRYPWINSWIPITEPLTVAIMGGLSGRWFPWHACDASFVSMTKHLAQAICLASQTLLKLNPDNRIVHVDPAEHHATYHPLNLHWDEESGNLTRFYNERRFLMGDLTLGHIDSRHPMWWYLERYGLKAKDVEWFDRNRATIHTWGLDCYFFNTEHWWQKEQLPNRRGHIVPSPQPQGFAQVILAYIDHFASANPQMQFKVTEFNTPGFIEDRIMGLKYMLHEYTKVEEWLRLHGQHRYGRKVELQGLHYFPLVDSVGWWNNEMCSLSPCSSEQGTVFDANGIYWVSADGTRQHSELSQLFSKLVRGGITYRELPACHFNSDLRKDLAGYEPLIPFARVSKPTSQANPAA